MILLLQFKFQNKNQLKKLELNKRLFAASNKNNW